MMHRIATYWLMIVALLFQGVGWAGFDAPGFSQNDSASVMVMAHTSTMDDGKELCLDECDSPEECDMSMCTNIAQCIGNHATGAAIPVASQTITAPSMSARRAWLKPRSPDSRSIND